jgi:hypothetical protein
LKPETFDLSPEQYETPAMGTVDPQLIEFCENIQAGNICFICNSFILLT